MMQSSDKTSDSPIPLTFTLGTAGHIDHGKTALVRALTGMDTDSLAEEKRRGISIDLGFAHTDVQTRRGLARIAIVDVPGHERFIRNMLAGATGIDLALVCVAVDDGVMPQTREHLEIIRLLGIRGAIFVITKADLATGERLKAVKRDIEALVKGTTLSVSPVCSTSTRTGQGIEELKALIAGYVERSVRDSDDVPFRLPIDRSFAVKGFGAVVTGTVASGSIKKGDEAMIFPTGAHVRVRGIQSTHKDAYAARTGQRVALNLSGVEHKDVRRGFMVCSKELAAFFNASPANRFQADCLIEFVEEASFDGKFLSNVKVHHLTAETLASVRFIGTTVARQKAVLGRLYLKTPLPMLRGDRFILRDPARNMTIGGGIVVLPYPSPSLAPRLADAGFLYNNDTPDVICGLLDSVVVIDLRTLGLMLNERAPEKDFARSLKVIGHWAASNKWAEEIEGKTLGALSAHHTARPVQAGLDEETLYAAMRMKDRKNEFFADVIASLVERKVLKKDGHLVAMASHSPVLKLTGVDADIERALRAAIVADGFGHIGTEALGKLLFKDSDVKRVLGYLQKTGVLVKLKEGSYIRVEAEAASRVAMIEHIKAKHGIKAAEFRDIVGCGRKLAIEILEYFDKERVTLRNGDVRTLR
ncbi:MAG: selenocysteine-specific translation elongation factor [Deltaproteobacteria bacterium]|nr:selenocysteine-specific translation elongation factor [Deltaproteobacteria bacterium]